MVNNGSLHYDHDRDGTHTELAGCEAKFRNKQYETSMLVRYVDDTISVSEIFTAFYTFTNGALAFAVHYSTRFSTCEKV